MSYIYRSIALDFVIILDVQFEKNTMHIDKQIYKKRPLGPLGILKTVHHKRHTVVSKYL